VSSSSSPSSSSSSSSSSPYCASAPVPADIPNPVQFKGQTLGTWNRLYGEVKTDRAYQYLPFISEYTFNRSPAQSARYM
jgi:hypothetical protein